MNLFRVNGFLDSERRIYIVAAETLQSAEDKVRSRVALFGVTAEPHGDIYSDMVLEYSESLR